MAVAEFGLKGMSNDVERCLSLVRLNKFFNIYYDRTALHVILLLKMNVQCVEERMRGLISNMIRMSKQVSYFL